ncbi:MAG: hypothetical protein HOY79_33655 [Streptomyces sp.]|nr:hypothetical protein [Streptomyces sp.]NUS11361.1 hypothetical protein [Streptomyces sp.]NUS23498.1 hypothetical protein [Streptomyces sp.]
MSDDTAPKQQPTAAEEAQARAYLAGIAYGFGVLMEDWFGWQDGTATTSDKHGNRLIYTGDDPHPFDAVIPCNRHRRHRVGVTYAHDLTKALADTALCSAKAPVSPKPQADPPTVLLRAVTPRPAVTPTPLHQVSRLADIPGRDRQKPA